MGREQVGDNWSRFILFEADMFKIDSEILSESLVVHGCYCDPTDYGDQVCFRILTFVLSISVEPGPSHKGIDGRSRE